MKTKNEYMKTEGLEILSSNVLVINYFHLAHYFNYENYLSKSLESSIKIVKIINYDKNKIEMIEKYIQFLRNKLKNLRNIEFQLSTSFKISLASIINQLFD